MFSNQPILLLNYYIYLTCWMRISNKFVFNKNSKDYLQRVEHKHCIYNFHSNIFHEHFPQLNISTFLLPPCHQSFPNLPKLDLYQREVLCRIVTLFWFMDCTLSILLLKQIDKFGSHFRIVIALYSVQIYWFFKYLLK